MKKSDAIKAALPICFGYVPLGLACGVVSQKAGLSPLEIGLLSIFVFAGSAQFIAASMFGANASISSIILTTFIVNLLHIMMSSALTVFFNKQKKRVLSLFASEITDETFAVNLNEFSNKNWSPQQALNVNHLSHFVWIVSNVIGSIGGEFIPPGAFGINFTLTAMFIGLISLQFKNLYFVFAAVVSGILAVFFSIIFKSNIYIVLASILSSTIFYFIRSNRQKPSLLKSLK